MTWTTGPFGKWGRWHEGYIAEWRRGCFVRFLVLTGTLLVAAALVLSTWVNYWELLNWRMWLFSVPLGPGMPADVPWLVVRAVPVVVGVQVLWLLYSHERSLPLYWALMYFAPVPGTLVAYGVLVRVDFKAGWLPRPAPIHADSEEWTRK